MSPLLWLVLAQTPVDTQQPPPVQVLEGVSQPEPVPEPVLEPDPPPEPQPEPEPEPVSPPTDLSEPDPQAPVEAPEAPAAPLEDLSEPDPSGPPGGQALTSPEPQAAPNGALERWLTRRRPTQTVAAPVAVSVDWLPGLGQGGRSAFLKRLLLAAVALLGARLASSVRERLPEGRLARFARWTRTSLRITVAALVLAALAALLPPALLPVVGWLLVAGALALGWGARDVLADVWSGLVLASEGSPREGDWIEGDGFRGVVQHLGTRSATLRAPAGVQRVPYSVIARGVHASRHAPGPQVTAQVALPGDADPARVRRALQQVVAASPWVDGRSAPSFGQTAPGTWQVQVTLLSQDFSNPFVGTLHERVTAELKARQDKPARRTDGSKSL